MLNPGRPRRKSTDGQPKQKAWHGGEGKKNADQMGIEQTKMLEKWCENDGKWVILWVGQ